MTDPATVLADALPDVPALAPGIPSPSPAPNAGLSTPGAAPTGKGFPWSIVLGVLALGALGIWYWKARRKPSVPTMPEKRIIN